MKGLSPQIQKTLAFGILGSVLLLIWQIAVDPVLDIWDNSGSGVTRQEQLLNTYRSAIDNDGQWTALLKKTQQAPYNNIFLSESDPDLAAARLQQDVKSITEASHGEIRSIQVLPTGKDHGLARAGVRVAFSVPLVRMADLLKAYTAARPFLYADSLQISADNGGADAKKPVLLRVTCKLYAYLKPAAP
jgi:hypothetical protein